MDKTMKLCCSFFTALLLGSLVSCHTSVDLESDQIWPGIKTTHRPGTYWWWMGSAVDEKNITYNLENLCQAGIGGVTIVPIYGVVGEEARYIDYLTPRWMEMLDYTIREADRLGMWVDMTTGTGWPFGGAHVTEAQAAKKLDFSKIDPEDPSVLSALVNGSSWYVLLARSPQGETTNITSQVTAEMRLNWQKPSEEWQVFFFGQSGTGQKVKRAAPGNHGLVLDPFSSSALAYYLGRFNEAFERNPGRRPRAHYHDSYEYYNANWTTDFLVQFQQRRGYDLVNLLPFLFETGNEEISRRIKSDFRETLAELHLAYIESWVSWAHERGSRTRDQAHGAPGNLLDIYAAADIPETETFGSTPFAIKGFRREAQNIGRDAPNPLVLQFSSSAAHVTGEPLIASETCTWLRNHFKAALSQAKPEIDQLFLSGINHIFYHGNAYSPADASWPGWLFYASTHFEKENAFWYDFPSLNTYVTRCQSILQGGRPDQDILLYWPVYDLWADPAGLEKKFTVHEIRWFTDTAFGQLASLLRSKGYSFDYISDHQLEKADWKNEMIKLPGGGYRTIIIPTCSHMPLSTWEKLYALAESGAPVLFQERLPDNIPGYYQFQERRRKLNEVTGSIAFDKSENTGISKARVGSGYIVKGHRIENLLDGLPVKVEGMKEKGISFIRRRYDDGYAYFLANLSSGRINEWIPLAVKAKSAAWLDPLSGNRGRASTKNENEKFSVYLQLASGQSCILRTYDNKEIQGDDWPLVGREIETIPLEGDWQIEFIQGGPDLPASCQINRLQSWTNFPDPDCLSFAGTARYRLYFQLEEPGPYEWILDLGEVRESARIKINGEAAGTLWSLPYRLAVGKYLQKGKNLLELEVTNLSANRIADMDRRGIVWRKFHDINFVNIDYEKFDASHWPLMASGLIGPVKLVAHAAKVIPHLHEN